MGKQLAEDPQASPVETGPAPGFLPRGPYLFLSLEDFTGVPPGLERLGSVAPGQL